MQKIHSFRDLRIWQEAHALTMEVYRQTAHFPNDEKFGITAQLRRSAASISANICEGMGRGSARDFLRFLYFARGSVQETSYHCLLARDLGYFNAEVGNSLVDRYDGLSAGIQSFIAKIQARTPKQNS